MNSVRPTTKHPLQRYLRREKRTLSDLSRASGVAKATISRVLSGARRRFSAEAALAIEKATGGKVTFEDCWKPSLKHSRTQGREGGAR